MKTAIAQAGKQRLLSLFKRFNDTETYQEFKEELIEQNRKNGIKCPHCHESHVVKNGKYRDRQRYKCNDCGRTFNDFTGTPLHGTHYLNKWMKFLECMVEGFSLRRSAIRVGVTYVTLFYWRHKLIQILEELEKKGGTKEMKLVIADSRSRSYSQSKFICVRLYPPLHEVSIIERKEFETWIAPFDWIARKYFRRYLAWFRFIQKVKNEDIVTAMKKMLLTTGSIRFQQTYESLRHAT